MLVVVLALVEREMERETAPGEGFGCARDLGGIRVGSKRRSHAGEGRGTRERGETRVTYQGEVRRGLEETLLAMVLL